MSTGLEIAEKSRTQAKVAIKKPSLFSYKSIRAALLVTALYLAVSYLVVGFKPDQLVLAAIFNSFYFASHVTRRFILGFSIFIIYWVVFDYMKAFPNYQYNEVHIGSLYNAEKSLFGIYSNNILLTPNEFFALHTSTIADVFAGLFYLCWVPLPLAFAGVLFFKNRRFFFQFSLTFFLVNLIGFAGYYLYPAAPPWYVAQHGFEFAASTPGNTAGLGRFDALTGVHIFEGIYAKSSNVFAAMPSLHAAYMLIVLFFGIKLRFGWWNIVFAVVVSGIWAAAVYSGHHYILDVLAGILCAVAGIALFQFWYKTKTGARIIDKLVKSTST